MLSLLFVADILREAPYSTWVVITTFQLKWNRQWDAIPEGRSVIFWNYTTNEFVILESMWQFTTFLDVVDIPVFQTKSLEFVVAIDVMQQSYCFIKIYFGVGRVGRMDKNTSRPSHHGNQLQFLQFLHFYVLTG